MTKTNHLNAGHLNSPSPAPAKAKTLGRAGALGGNAKSGSTRTVGDHTVYTQDQPNGEKGIRFSLDQVADKISQGRIHPDVIAWTRTQLAAAGNPKGPRHRAKAVLDALRAQSGWVPDPTDAEFMPGAHLMLGDGVKKAFYALGDCFPEGTMMLGEDGKLVAVEKLREGMKIWGLHTWSTVSHVAHKGSLSIDVIRLNNGSDLRLTHDHHVYVLDCRHHPMLTEGENPKALRRTDTQGCDCAIDSRVEQRICVAELTKGMQLPAPSGPKGDPSPMSRQVAFVKRDVEEVPCWDITTNDSRVYLPINRVTVSQCDDLTIAWGAATLAAVVYLAAAESVGAQAAVVGHAYGPEKQIEHVLGAIYDEGRWWYADPSLKDVPFGECKPFTRERVLRVPSRELLCDDKVCLRPGGSASGPPPPARRGDFVAVDGAPGQDSPLEPPGLLGAYDLGCCGADAPSEALSQIQIKRNNEALAVLDVMPIDIMWFDAGPPNDVFDRNTFLLPPNVPIIRQELNEPWNDGLEPVTGENWVVRSGPRYPLVDGAFAWL